MKVGVICRMNQARSPFAELVLQNLFPGNQFISAGTNTFSNSTPEPRVDLIAQNWDLGKLKNISEHVSEQREEILACDFVITAERKMISTVRKLGYQGRVFDFESTINEKSFVPTDPIGLPLEVLKQEIAKVAYCAVRNFRVAVEYKNSHSVQLYIPTREHDSVQAYLTASLANSRNPGVVLDVDFRSPGASKSIEDFEVVGLESLEELIEIRECRSVVYSQKWEKFNPESMLLSNLFKTVVRELSNRFPVYLVAAPRFTHHGVIPDSYLAGLWADSITIISS